tara:strand:- start:1159 stop:1815 length:657 start_codon:yes stop_codon:yes gene_type:complete
MATFLWVSLFTNNDVNRNNFITNLRVRLCEDTADIIQDTQLFAIIDAGLRDINFRTKLLPEYQEVTLDGSAQYDLAAGTSSIQNVFFLDTGGEWRELVLSSLEEITRIERPNNSRPDFYVRNGNKIAVFGSAADSSVIRIYAARIPTLPTTGTDFIDLPPQYLELLYYYAQWIYWIRRREPDEATVFGAFYTNMAELVKEEVQTEFGQNTTLYGKDAC